ncbi:MAG: tetratricopeptide repeat protein, partial [Cyanobacteria bacterium J06638_20]
MPNDTPPNPEAIAEATNFLREVLQRIDRTEGNQQKLFEFFKANLERLDDEALLSAIPFIFAELTAKESTQRAAGFLILLNLFRRMFKKSRQDIAADFNSLGIYFNEFPLGNRALNQELSIAAYQAALQVRTREAFPQNWAMTQNNLGNAYKNRIRGERADNLERAIDAYQAALQVRTREAFPQDWAMTQNNLGNAYGNRIRGERADNLERAIDAYQSALQVYTREAFPQQWAMTQNNLGTAYKNRIRGERADNLERAIDAYQSALQV